MDNCIWAVEMQLSRTWCGWRVATSNSQSSHITSCLEGIFATTELLFMPIFEYWSLTLLINGISPLLCLTVMTIVVMHHPVHLILPVLPLEVFFGLMIGES